MPGNISSPGSALLHDSQVQRYKYPNSLSPAGNDFALEVVHRAAPPPAELSQSYRTWLDCILAWPLFLPIPASIPLLGFSGNKILVSGNPTKHRQILFYASPHIPGIHFSRLKSRAVQAKVP